MKRSDLLWLAGYLEGEGCFYLGRDHGKLRATIQVETTDRDVAERVADILGTIAAPMKRKDRPRNKPYYRVRLAHARAVMALEKLSPLMGVRRQRTIRQVLAFHGQAAS